MITVQNEKVVINGEDVILFGGELHYFRVPASEWKGRIQQIKAAGGNMVSTYVPWKFHEPVEGEIDLSGKTRPEKDLKKFFEIIQEENMYCLVRPGPYVMAEIDDHGVPSWFIDNYDEAMAKDRDGNSHSLRLVSYLHPTYIEKTEKWYQHVCEVIEPYQVTNGGPIVMFQLDNEVGMFHWVTNMGDYNAATLQLFGHYLEKKYSLETFNETYALNVDSIQEFAMNKVKQVEECYAFAVQNDYSLFMREHYREYIELLKGLAEKFSINVPFVVNIHGFDTIGGILKRGMKYPIGVSQLLETAKIENVMLAGDYYIGNIEYDNYTDLVVANAFTRSVQPKEQPLFSAEFQGGCTTDKPRLQPSSFDLITRLSFANGMNAVNYYMFVSGENWENIGIHGKRHDWQTPVTAYGKERAHYKTIQHLGKMFKTYNNALINAKPEYNTHLAFYPDYFMTELYNEFSLEMLKEIESWREDFLYNGIAKGLTTRNIAYDGYNLLEEGRIDVKKIPSLWVFSTKWMDEKIQDKLVSYVKEGGKLIIFPTLPTETMKQKPCTILKDFIGVEQKEMKEGFSIILNIENIAANMQTFEETQGAFVWTEDEDKDVVAFQKSIGAGFVAVVGLAMDCLFEYQLDAIKEIANHLDVYSSFEFDRDVDAVDAFARIADDGSKFIFLHNFDDYEKKTSVTFKGEKLFGGKGLVIPRKSGLMLPIMTKLVDDIVIEYATAEIFGCTVLEKVLELKVRAIQDEEFIFCSEQFEPVSEEGIHVEKLGQGRYLVQASKMSDEIVLKFRR